MQGGFKGFIYWLSRVMQVVAGVFLVFMMLLTTFDVILRIFSRPIIGTYEMVALVRRDSYRVLSAYHLLGEGTDIRRFLLSEVPKERTRYFQLRDEDHVYRALPLHGLEPAEDGHGYVQVRGGFADTAASFLSRCLRNRFCLLRAGFCLDSGHDEDRGRRI